MAKRRRTPTRPIEPRPLPPRRQPRGRPASTAGRRPTTLLVGAAALIGVGVLVGAVANSLLSEPSPSPGASVNASATVDLGPTATPGPPVSLIPAPSLPTAEPDGLFPPISSVGCDELEQTAYHLHAHLTIRFGGQVAIVPNGIGIRDTCFYWLHTHANAGVIHVEAPAEAMYTLGAFFDVWGQVLAERQVLDRPLQPNEGLYVFIDGERYEGDPRGIVLSNLLTIEIQVGTAPFTPLPYEWSPDFL